MSHSNSGAPLTGERCHATRNPELGTREVALEHLDFAIEEFRAMRMQPSLERSLRHKPRSVPDQRASREGQSRTKHRGRQAFEISAPRRRHRENRSAPTVGLVAAACGGLLTPRDAVG